MVCFCPTEPKLMLFQVMIENRVSLECYMFWFNSMKQGVVILVGISTQLVPPLLYLFSRNKQNTKLSYFFCQVKPDTIQLNTWPLNWNVQLFTSTMEYWNKEWNHVSISKFISFLFVGVLSWFDYREQISYTQTASYAGLLFTSCLILI